MKDGRNSGKRTNADRKTAGYEQPVVRTSVVERGRKLLADPSYPNLNESRDLAKILLPML